jgi:predicted enzyme related to lactoylglutathione lyase
MAKKNPIEHIEWRTRDAARLRKFYAALFNWKFDDVQPGHYTMVDFGNEGGGGGIWHMTPDVQMPPGICNYITVESLEKTEAKIKELGGNVLVSKQPVEGWGHFSVFTDVDNNTMAIWERASKKEKKQAKKAAEKAHEAQKAAKKAAKKEQKAAKKAAKKEKQDKKADKKAAAPSKPGKQA